MNVSNNILLYECMLWEIRVWMINRDVLTLFIISDHTWSCHKNCMDNFEELYLLKIMLNHIYL